MKVNITDELSFVVFLNKYYIKNIDFNNKNEMENYFKSLFIRFKDYYNIDIGGFYDINVYKDEQYGIILDIKKDDLDYMDYCYNQVDMRIVISNDCGFIYKINNLDVIENVINDVKLYFYNNNLYISFIKNVDINKIIEHIDIIYGNNVNKIIKNGKLINKKEVNYEKISNCASG